MADASSDSPQREGPKLASRAVGRLLDGLDRVTPARLFLCALITALIGANGLARDWFNVDSVTIGLLAVLAVIVLVPLLSEATFPGGGSLKFREATRQVLRDSEEAAPADQHVLSNRPVKGAPTTSEAVVEGDADGSPTLRSAPPRFAPPVRTADEVVGEILGEARRSPTLALLMLNAELERAVRVILYSTGWVTGQTASLRGGIERLVELGVLTPSAASALDGFAKIRSEVVHGSRRATDEEVLAAVDAAIPLLRAVLAIPRERNVVAFTEIPLFRDAEGTSPIEDAHGLILETLSPGAALVSFRIFPTTRAGYVIGKEVTWEWNAGRVWDEAWYRDPDTKELKRAWLSSTEFVGRHLDEI